MFIEVKSLKFTCDGCKKVKVVRDVPFWELPKGWSQIESTGCGLTNYTGLLDICPTCKRKKKNG